MCPTTGTRSWWTAGTFNGRTVEGIGIHKAAAIYYQAMTEYQTPISGFPDHAESLEASCADLTGRSIKQLSTMPNDSQTFRAEDHGRGLPAGRGR